VMSIGSTRTLYYSLNTTVAGLTPVWESANPEVATIDQTGLVTAVGAGHTEIYLHYGPATLTAGVRVYDSSITAAVPEYYMAVKPNAQAIPYQSAYFFVGVATDPATLGSSLPLCSIVFEAVDASGTAVAKIRQSSYGVQYVNTNETSISNSIYPDDLARYVALGATHLRMRIVESSSYTIDASRAYADLPIQDPTLWGRNTIGLGVPDLAFGGQKVTVPIKLVSCTGSVYGKTVTVNVSVTDNVGNDLAPMQTFELTADAPDGSIAIDLPQGVTYAYISYSASSSGGSWSGGKSMNIASIVQPDDEAVAIGDTCYTYVNGNNLSGLARSYESSNPEVATVNETGAVTGVSAGIAVITAHVGPMQTSFSVRVYDPYGEHAVPNLSLSVDGAEPAMPNQQVSVTVSTDTDVTTLGGSSSINLYRQYLDAEGNAVGSPYSDTYMLTFAAKQTKEILVYLNGSEINTALVKGATQVRVYAEESGSYTVEPGMDGVTIPLADPADWGYMAIGWDMPGTLIAGREITVNVKMLADSPYDPGKNYTFTFYANTSSGDTVVDYEARTINMQNPTASYTFTPPEGASYLYIGYRVRAEGSSYDETSYSNNIQVITLPEMTHASTLAELQSEHDYANNMNHAWSYTVEGATSLQVYFSSQSQTEGYYDHVMIGSLSGFEAGSMENDYTGYIGGYNVIVRGDTVVIWLKTDSSSTYYGFSVDRIEATMADGSKVTITE